ncbi:MAG: hypothetical protein HN353_06650 [Bdellovibrionales bacterium]|nr:hypothetical protein [Bdellovibrionales bacterium]MBT3526434.1 hypothetical protein [Bdellovibrionales bacterium]MBT7765704.1 hypothetical protein [Bdellovibrionales bacterium]
MTHKVFALFSRGHITLILIFGILLSACNSGTEEGEKVVEVELSSSSKASPPLTTATIQPKIASISELLATQVSALPIPLSIDEIIEQFAKVDTVQSKQEEIVLMEQTFEQESDRKKIAHQLKERISEEGRLDRLMSFINLMGQRVEWNSTISDEYVMNRDLQIVKYLVQSLQKVESAHQLGLLREYFGRQVEYLVDQSPLAVDDTREKRERKVDNKRLVSVYFSLEYLLDRSSVIKLIGAQALKVHLTPSVNSASDMLAHRAFYYSLKAANRGEEHLLPREFDTSLISSSHANAIFSIRRYVAGKIDQSTLLDHCDQYFSLLDYPIKRFRPAGLPADHKLLLNVSQEYLSRIVSALDSRELLISSLERVLTKGKAQVDERSGEQVVVWPSHPLTRMVVVQAAVNRGSIAKPLLQFFSDSFQSFSDSYDQGLGGRYWSGVSNVMEVSEMADTNLNRAVLYRHHQYNYYKNQFFIQQFQILRLLAGEELSDPDLQVIDQATKRANYSSQQQQILRRPYDRWINQIKERLQASQPSVGIPRF